MNAKTKGENLKNSFDKEYWYEVQRLYNFSEGNPGEWLMWEQFPYDHTTQKASPRLNARNRAKKELLNSHNLGWEVRMIHCELLYSNI